MSCSVGPISTPSWRHGNLNNKTTSIAQTLFLAQINSGANKTSYDLDAHTLRQLHKSRAYGGQNLQNENVQKIKGKKRKCPFPGEIKIGKRKYNAPHFALATTFDSGSILGILDEKFYFRSEGKTSSEITFADVDYDPEKQLKVQFRIQTENSGKFGNDRDVYYPALNSDETSIKLKDCHRSLLLLLNSGKSLQSFHMDSGLFKEQLDLDGGFECSKTGCHENGSIVLECKKKNNTRDKNILMEFVILRHIPLRFEARVQIMRSICNHTRKSPTRFEVFGDFLFGFCGSNRIDLYDLAKILELCKLNSPSSLQGEEHAVTHRVEKLPLPLLSIKCVDSFLDFYPMLLPGFYIIRLADFDYEVREVNKGRSVDITVDGCDELNFEEDTRVHFLSSGPPRVVAIGRNRMKIFLIAEYDLENSVESGAGNDLENGIVNGLENGGKNGAEKGEGTVRERKWYLKLIFDLNFGPKEEDLVDTSTRKSVRKFPRKYYDLCANTTIIYDHNEYLQQIAVVRFEAKKISCFVYDSMDFKLQYEITARHFAPVVSEVYDNITLQFTNKYVAVVRKGTKDSTIYVFNLLKTM